MPEFQADSKHYAPDCPMLHGTIWRAVVNLHSPGGIPFFHQRILPWTAFTVALHTGRCCVIHLFVFFRNCAAYFTGLGSFSIQHRGPLVCIRSTLSGCIRNFVPVYYCLSNNLNSARARVHKRQVLHFPGKIRSQERDSRTGRTTLSRNSNCTRETLAAPSTARPNLRPPRAVSLVGAVPNAKFGFFFSWECAVRYVCKGQSLFAILNCCWKTKIATHKTESVF